MEPPLPLVALPVPTAIKPEVPAGDAPVEMFTDPLVPRDPPELDATVIFPLDPWGE
jgi:hypothetical protein